MVRGAVPAYPARRVLAWSGALLACLALGLFGWLHSRKPDLTHPARPFRVGFHQSAPYQIVGPNGNATGIATEVVREACRRLGIPITWVRCDAGPLDALTTDKADLWPVLVKLPERKKSVYISEPWITSSYWMVTQQSRHILSPADAAGLTVAHRPDTMAVRMKEMCFPKSKSAVFATTREVFEAVCTGQVDVAQIAGSQAHSAELQEARGARDVALRFYPLTSELVNLGIGASYQTKDAREAADAIREEIGRMSRDGSLSGIYYHWFLNPNNETETLFYASEVERRNRILTTCVIVLATLLVFVGWLGRRVIAARNEARRAVEMAREHEAMRRIAGRLGQIGGWAVDLKSGRLTWSDEVCRIHDVPPGTSPTYEEALAFYEPEVRAVIARKFRECLRDGTAYDAELPMKTATGRAAWVRVLGEAERDATGAIVRVHGAFQDISERKAAEKALKSSEEAYRRLFDGNPVPMWIYDPATLQIIEVNAAAVTQYGYSREEFIKMTLADIRPAADAALLDEIRRIPVDATIHRATRHLRKHGHVIDVEVVSQPIVFQGRRGRLVLATDVTARKQAQQRVAEQAALLDLARDGIVVRDLDGRILFWNEGAKRIYHWTADEAAGRTFSELLQVERHHVERATQAVFAHGEWHGEITAKTKEGAALTLDSRWTLLRDANHQPKSFLTIDTDVTEKKALEQQFLRAQRLESIGTLAGGIAHDLNNLLAPIVMGVGMLKQSAHADENRWVIQAIETAANRGAGLVRKILSFARGVEGARVSTHIGYVVREIEFFITSTFPKNIVFASNVPEDIPLIVADLNQLNQALLNLCVNARDAMPDGGRLTIEARAVEFDGTEVEIRGRGNPGTYVMVEVRDTGIGMTKEVAEKIFEPFFTTKELGKGTGLGLATVMGIVRGHGGFLTVQSEPGRGSTFRMFLPAGAAEAGAAEEPPEQPASLLRGRGETILLVDDEFPILHVTRSALEKFGYKVLVAQDGHEALTVYQANAAQIRVVLTDMMMPGMDGPALILALRAINPDVCIVGASGLNDTGGADRATELGIRHFMPKPYSIDRLVSTLAEVLEPNAETLT